MTRDYIKQGPVKPEEMYDNPPPDKNSALVEAAWNAVTALERDTYTPLMRSIAATKLREAIASAPSHVAENVRPVPGCSFPDCACAPHDRCVHVDAMLAKSAPSTTPRTAKERIAAVRADQAGEPITAKQAADALVGLAVTEAMVDRFLSWPLPKSVCSDTCASNPSYPYPRCGTNLLAADEAKASAATTAARIAAAAQIPRTTCGATFAAARAAGPAATRAHPSESWRKHERYR